MAIPHAQPGEVVYAGPLGPALAATKTSTLIKTKSVEVVHMVVPAGKEIKDHKAPGELLVQCVEGKIAFTAMGRLKILVLGRCSIWHLLKSIQSGHRRFVVLADDLAKPDRVDCLGAGAFCATYINQFCNHVRGSHGLASFF